MKIWWRTKKLFGSGFSLSAEAHSLSLKEERRERKSLAKENFLERKRREKK